MRRDALGSMSFTIWGSQAAGGADVRKKDAERVIFCFLGLIAAYNFFAMVSLPGVVTNAYSSITLNWTAPTTNTDVPLASLCWMDV